MNDYNESHAQLYDTFKNPKVYEQDVETINTHLEDSNVEKIVDIGCGTGHHASLMSDQGYQVIGIDINKAMLKVARQKHPEITFREQSATTTPPDTDVITMFDSVYTYLSSTKQREAIKSYADSLTKNGFLYLDIAFTTKTTPKNGWQTKDTATWKNTVYEKNTRTERDQDTVQAHITIRDHDDNTVVDETTHKHHIVDPDKLRTQLREHNFTILKEAGHSQDPWKNWEIICARR